MSENPATTYVVVKQQLSNDIRTLEANGKELVQGQQRLAQGVAAIDALSKREDGSTILLPLTEQLLIPGEIVDPKHVMVSLGAGYSVVRSTE